jgi:hypothetical protein
LIVKSNFTGNMFLSFAGATQAQESLRGLPMPALKHHGAAV